jgi:hypothetical protein
VNEPLATPGQVWTWWLWQVDGQCCISSSHDSAEGGRAPSWASVAEPEKLRTSPTFHAVPDVGVAMVGVGAVLPTEMTTVSVAVSPSLSVTRSDAAKVPETV